MQQFITRKNIIITGKPYEVIIQLKQLCMEFSKINELMVTQLPKTE